MSDFRDPREPPKHDPMYGGFNDPLLGSYPRESIGPLATFAWLFGMLFVIGVLIYAFGSTEGTRTAQYNLTPPAADKTMPAPKFSAPPAAQPAPAMPGGAPVSDPSR